MMPAEAAHDTVAAIGEVGLLQFKDLNPDKSPFQRTFANQVPTSGPLPSTALPASCEPANSRAMTHTQQL